MVACVEIEGEAEIEVPVPAPGLEMVLIVNSNRDGKLRGNEGIEYRMAAAF